MSILNSFKYALKGIKYVIKNEGNFRIHLILTALILVVCSLLKFNYIEFLLIIIAITLVLVTEMINSAIEYTWNKLEPNHHPVVGIIKDVMAGSVLVSSIGAIIIGLTIIIRHL